MGSIFLDLQMIFDGWVHALSIFIVTVLLTGCTRTFLRQLRQRHDWGGLRELTPSISNIILLIGLKAAVENAPLKGRLEIWTEGIFYLITVLVFLRLIQRAALIGIEWSISKAHPSQELELGFIPLLRNLLTLFIFMMGAIMILKHFNYDVLSLITALGVGSLAVGLAAKDTLSNMISGFILIIDRNLRPGDRVNLGGSVGDVREIGLRSTLLRMTDGNTLIVPNSDLVNTKILNLSLPSREMSCFSEIRVPYSVPFNRLKTISFSILKKMERLSNKRPPSVTLASLSEGFQLVRVSFWISDLDDANAMISHFNEQLLMELEKEKITLVPA